MRNPYTRPGGMFGRRNAGGFTRASAAAASGPTVILNADYLTDTLLQEGDIAIADGTRVNKWTFATGGTATFALAQAAGAVSRPTYIAASGVHTDGESSAVTLPTPVTIPADADCVIYVKANLPSTHQLYALGSSSVAARRVEIGGDGDCQISIATSLAASVSAYFAVDAAGTKLFRLRRVSGAWSCVMSGGSEIAMSGSGDVTGAVAIDTLLGFSSAGSGLDSFSAAGCCIQKIKIWSGTSDPDAAYETANGGAL